MLVVTVVRGVVLGVVLVVVPICLQNLKKISEKYIKVKYLHPKYTLV